MGSQSDKTIFNKYINLLNERSGNKGERKGVHLLTKTRANYFAAGSDQTEADFARKAEIAKKAEIAREALRSIDRILAQALAQIPPEVQVPRRAETILSYLYPPELIEGMLGDLEEDFRRITTKRGVAAARWWYRWQTARSVIASVGNLLLRVAAILEALRKLGF